MSGSQGKILIVDEAGFSSVCNAILKFEGYSTETAVDPATLLQKIESGEFKLIITSYPFGMAFLGRMRHKAIPVIVLSDQVSKDLLAGLEDFHSSYCMVKPLDYQKFKGLVKELLESPLPLQGGFAVV